MADESKPPHQKWYHTAPGYLTATAALVGSITAAVTALSQLGVFHSKVFDVAGPPYRWNAVGMSFKRRGVLGFDQFALRVGFRTHAALFADHAALFIKLAQNRVQKTGRFQVKP